MSLEDELSCAVCTELFTDPVLLSCGHSFCRQCINNHWSSSRSRNCPVCRQLSPQQPLSNLSLRNTCECYLRENNTRKERDGEHVCQIHGEKIELFCQTDEQVLCSECKHEHGRHRIQPLQQAVRQRKQVTVYLKAYGGVRQLSDFIKNILICVPKINEALTGNNMRGKLKADLRSAEKTLVSLQNGTAQYNKISRYIQSQGQQTETRIREEFEKLHQFLRTEEESRISALNEEEKEKRGKMGRRIQGGILSLCDRVRELKEEIEDEDITFLQNYPSMNRAKYTLPDAELSSEALIDVPKHLGNLKYHVWEKMKDVCPYYPVILNPNTSPADVSVSDDLTSVTSCLHRQDEINPLPLHWNRMVLGTVGYIDGHLWDVEVGSSRHWSLGVCFGLAGKPPTQPLTPENGFWGLRRDGDSYRAMAAGSCRLQVMGDPEIVRVKLECCYELVQEPLRLKRWRKLSFSDVRINHVIAVFDRVPLANKLFPFMILEDQSVPLRVVPANVILTVEKELSFMERYRYLLIICFGLVMVMLGILIGKSDRQGR